jgi:hypothetical protein
VLFGGRNMDHTLCLFLEVGEQRFDISTKRGRRKNEDQQPSDASVKIDRSRDGPCELTLVPSVSYEDAYTWIKMIYTGVLLNQIWFRFGFSFGLDLDLDLIF